MNLTRINTTAEGGDCKPIVEFHDGTAVVARCFKTYHPTIPWETFVYGTAERRIASKRTMTVDEAESFVRETLDSPSQAEAGNEADSGV